MIIVSDTNRPWLSLRIFLVVGPNICPGYCSLARIVHDQRPYGVTDAHGLYRITSVPEKVGMQAFYNPVDNLSQSLADRNGQKSIYDLFTSSQLENVRKSRAPTSLLEMNGNQISFPRGSQLFS